jgi:hypothetical protein
MTKTDVEIIIQRAKEKHPPDEKPRPGKTISNSSIFETYRKA